MQRKIIKQAPMHARVLRNIRRKQLDMTQTELAAYLEISGRSVSLYETGKQPIPMLVQLAVCELIHRVEDGRIY